MADLHCLPSQPDKYAIRVCPFQQRPYRVLDLPFSVRNAPYVPCRSEPIAAHTKCEMKYFQTFDHWHPRSTLLSCVHVGGIHIQICFIETMSIDVNGIGLWIDIFQIQIGLPNIRFDVFGYNFIVERYYHENPINIEPKSYQHAFQCENALPVDMRSINLPTGFKHRRAYYKL